jgi:hypothetical protein
MQKYEAAPAGDAHRVQIDRILVESRKAAHVRGGDQVSVEIV